MNGWAGTKDWKTVSGMLVNDGTEGTGVITAPYRPGDIADYAVEAEIQVLKVGHGFWITVRGGYRAGVGYWPAGAGINVKDDPFNAALVQLGPNHNRVQITSGQRLYVHWNGFAVRFQ